MTRRSARRAAAPAAPDRPSCIGSAASSASSWSSRADSGGAVAGATLQYHDVLMAQRVPREVAMHVEEPAPPLDHVIGPVEGRVVEVGEGAAEPGVLAQEHDPVAVEQPAHAARIAAVVARVTLE